MWAEEREVGETGMNDRKDGGSEVSNLEQGF